MCDCKHLCLSGFRPRYFVCGLRDEGTCVGRCSVGGGGPPPEKLSAQDKDFRSDGLSAMPFCGRKFNGSGYSGSRWSGFLDHGHGGNIRLPTNTHTHSDLFKFVHQIYSTVETEGSNGEVFICLGPEALRVIFFCTLLSLLLVSSSVTFTRVCVCVCVSYLPAYSICLSGSPFPGFPQTSRTLEL